MVNRQADQGESPATADGRRLVFSRVSDTENVYVGDLEAGPGRFKTLPRQLTLGERSSMSRGE